MFHLSCARMSAHISRETSAHKKPWSAHKCSFQNCFAHISRRSKYRWVLVNCWTKEILCAHRLWKIRGNIGPWVVRLFIFRSTLWAYLNFDGSTCSFSRRSLRSASRGDFLVPHARRATTENKAFSIAGIYRTSVWNSLPPKCRLSRVHVPVFPFAWTTKDFLFGRAWVGSAYLEGALYKFHR